MAGPVHHSMSQFLALQSGASQSGQLISTKGLPRGQALPASVFVDMLRRGSQQLGRNGRQFRSRPGRSPYGMQCNATTTFKSLASDTAATASMGTEAVGALKSPTDVMLCGEADK
ncbi:hypothetical protein HaLaN_00283 [Haematococcus lacustris]|uniref:Uncharacterized protein n=1 Tax=Haematococcus lacustris TaxID=44745 RepID=A0A699Y6J6_HAELA|nr:hypothetical protein HaLaN_00283 [Haematococcus lacustris]